MSNDQAKDTSKSTMKTKVCFVTVGATAPFDALIKAIFEPKFIQALHDADYTLLRVQHGHEGQDGVFQRLVGQAKVLDICESCKIDVSGFGFNRDGLDGELRGAKGIGPRGARQEDMIEGAVISHAGSGSILDVMRMGIPLIVVPNDGLLHGHQTELAVELSKQEYVVHGKLQKLAEAIPEVEKLRARTQQWPPVNSAEAKYPKGLAGVMDDEMGWVD